MPDPTPEQIKEGVRIAYKTEEPAVEIGRLLARIAELERDLKDAREYRDLEKSRAANAEKANRELLAEVDRLDAEAPGLRVERDYGLKRIAALEAKNLRLRKDLWSACIQLGFPRKEADERAGWPEALGEG